MPTKEERKEVGSNPSARPAFKFSDPLPLPAFGFLSPFMDCRFYKRMQGKSPYRTTSTLIISPTSPRGSRAPTSKRCYITRTLRSCMRVLATAKSQSRLQPLAAEAAAAARTTASTIRLSSTRHLEGLLRTKMRSSRAQSRWPRTVV